MKIEEEEAPMLPVVAVRVISLPRTSRVSIPVSLSMMLF